MTARLLFSGVRQLGASKGLDTYARTAHHSDIASGISIGIQMSELMRLLLKAVRSLPQDEQDTVLTELLGAKVVGGRPAQPSGQVARSDPGWASLTGVGNHSIPAAIRSRGAIESLLAAVKSRGAVADGADSPLGRAVRAAQAMVPGQ